MKSLVILAVVNVSVPDNWDKMSEHDRLQYVACHQDNHLLVDIKKIAKEVEDGQI